MCLSLGVIICLSALGLAQAPASGAVFESPSMCLNISQLVTLLIIFQSLCRK